jgi:hypothetical protein
MVIRTYFDRNNTLVYNRTFNTGKNPVAELFYGGGNNAGTKSFSRYIFQFDVDRIIKLRESGLYPDLTKLKHTLKMTNTGAFDSSLLGDITSDAKDRTSSFDLQLFEVKQGWDEGVGYDFSGQKFFTSLDATVISNNPSNWVEASGTTAWIDNGAFSWSGGTIIAEQHFEFGNENIDLDITDIVNRYLTGDTNNGLGLAFIESNENVVLDSLQYIGFFTRHTQTFYEPFVETRYATTINDSRGHFYMDKLNKIYLYVNLGGIPTDVDDDSTMVVNVMTDNDILFSSFTSTNITHESQGVYSIELIVPETESLGCDLFHDVWSGITIKGVSRPEVELDFELKPSDGYYNIGSEQSQPKAYKFNIYGLKDKEKINRGDIRKVSVMARVPYTVNQQEVVDTLEYRLYVKEGAAEYTVIDYTPVDLAFNYNYFLLDTASLIPSRYYLDIKLTSNYEVTTSKNVISFDITSQVDERKG